MVNGIDKKYLVDSNILIYHFNGVEAATDFLRNNLPNCYISRLTFIEVLSFDFGEAEQDVILFLKQFHILDTSDEIALQSLKNGKLKKIKLPDNLILCTLLGYEYGKSRLSDLQARFTIFISQKST